MQWAEVGVFLRLLLLLLLAFLHGTAKSQAYTSCVSFFLGGGEGRVEGETEGPLDIQLRCTAGVCFRSW